MRTETGKVILAMAVACLTAATASPQPAPHAETYRISGLVVNAVTGQPLSQVHVLYAPDDGSSKGIETTTGADGRFVFEPVPAGSWTHPRAAAPIQLKPGEEFTADFTLQRGSGVTVDVEGPTGVVSESASELLVLIIEGPQGSEVSAGTLGPGSGRTFYNVVPGRYKLVIADVRSTYATSRWIEVGSENLTVKLPFAEPAEVTAKVRVVNGDSSLLRNAMLQLAVFADAGNNARPLGADGTVVFPGLAAGRYNVLLAAPRLYIKSVTARNARVVDGLVDVPESGPVQLEIVAAGDGARVRGKVKAGEKPVSDALVVLAPSRPSVNSGDYQAYQSDSDGTFDFRGVKPGDYIVFAVNNDQLEYGNPAAIEKYLAAGKPVKAGANGSVELQLEPLIP